MNLAVGIINLLPATPWEGLTMVYSLSEAAKAVGMTRQGVLNAINKGTISAKKNDLGRWEIDPAELHRVYPPVNNLPETESKSLTVADGELILELRSRIADLQQERDNWMQQAQAWQAQAERMLPPGDRRGWWSRLFRRSG